MPINFKEQSKCGNCGSEQNQQTLFFNDGLCDKCWTNHWRLKHIHVQDGNKPQGMMAGR